MRELLAMLCVLCAALIVTVEGSASLLARPPLGKRSECLLFVVFLFTSAWEQQAVAVLDFFVSFHLQLYLMLLV